MRKYTSQAKATESKKGEINNLPSETVPDMAMSVREIMVRFANGTLDPVHNEPYYSEDLPDLRGMDISQIMEMKKDAQADVKRLQEEIKSRKEAPSTPKVEEATVVDEPQNPE